MASPRLRQGLAVALAVLCAAGLVLSWVWREGAQRRAIQALPPEERLGLYQRTMENLRSICGEPRPALADYCREQAELVLQFPECDAGCREIARRQFPTR